MAATPVSHMWDTKYAPNSSHMLATGQIKCYIFDITGTTNSGVSG